MDCQARVLALHTQHMELAVQPAAACSACGARRACQGDGDAGERGAFAVALEPGLAVGSTVTLRLQDERVRTLLAGTPDDAVG